MVDVVKAIGELEEKVSKTGNTDTALKLVIENHPKYGMQVFWVYFDDKFGELDDTCEDWLKYMILSPGVIISDLDSEVWESGGSTQSWNTEDLIKLYGDWYEPIAGYDTDEDEFREVPIEDVLKALSYFEFDSYEICFG